jgi:hypothetical protein
MAKEIVSLASMIVAERENPMIPAVNVPPNLPPTPSVPTNATTVVVNTSLP